MITLRLTFIVTSTIEGVKMLDTIWKFTIVGYFIYIAIRLVSMKQDIDLHNEIINTMLVEWDKK